MSQNCMAAHRRRSLRRHGRVEVIHDATALIMDEYGLDAGQAVAQLVKIAKRHCESIEAAARMCVAASRRGDHALVA